jgi:ATP-binding cassette subfamily B protein RaxB
VIWLGARRVLDGTFSVGLLLAFVAYKDQFLGRVSELINKGVDLTMLRVHSERLADIALTETEPRGLVVNAGDTAHLPAMIEARNVSFRYSENDPWILENVNFRVELGGSVAIIGPSGGGKTTLLKLLAGLLQPTKGEILVNGEPINRLGLENYRTMIGVVMQDDQLFAGSIAENICFFAEEPDQKRIEACAELAAVHSDIASMPMGYNTLIGDMGTALSGGQKQRVLLARALYRRPGILLLDEATSHLDVEREYAVNRALRSLRITRLVIAHRPETIRAADRVLALESGAIAESLQALRAPLSA